MTGNAPLKLEIKTALTAAHEQAFANTPHFDEIAMNVPDLITVKAAKPLSHVKSVRRLFIWSQVTRAAMRHLISRPGLEEMIINELRPSGRLEGFEAARSVTLFSAAFGLKSADLLEIAKLPQLRNLSAHMAEFTNHALEALIGHESLEELDLEDTLFNDEHAAIVARSKKITRLEIGATNLSAVGLAEICQMSQLEGLDLWSTRIMPEDLDLLTGLSNLEYLSIGREQHAEFSFERVIPQLEKLTRLKRIWLDGLTVTRSQMDDLLERYDWVGPMYVTD